MKSKESEGDKEKRSPGTEPWGISALTGLGKEKELAKETEEGPVSRGKAEEFVIPEVM